MDKSLAKNAVKQAKDELEEEHVKVVKSVIKSTLEAIEREKGHIAQHQRRLKALKQDMKDLEEGRLERIKERQCKDGVARKVSRVNVRLLGNGWHRFVGGTYMLKNDTKAYYIN